MAKESKFFRKQAERAERMALAASDDETFAKLRSPRPINEQHHDDDELGKGDEDQFAQRCGSCLR
jgi:hypothetical protein